MHDARAHRPLPLTADREALHAHLDTVWRLDEALLGALDPEALATAPDPLRRPLIFYYGHTAAFLVNKLRLAGLCDDGVDPHLDDLLARGVDPAVASELDAPRWPDAEVVRRYRTQARGIVERVIDRHQPRPVTPDDPAWALWMGLAHSRIHFETSSVLVRQLAPEHTRKPAGWCYAETGTPPPFATLTVPEGIARLGRPAELDHFGWDNEHGALEEPVAAFEVSRHLVTNADYLDFVRDGGYTRDDLWSPEGLAWRRRHAVRHPRFWVEYEPGRYAARAMFDVIPMPLDWPAEVNCHEALAYCAWKGDGWRLPSEAEHQRLAALDGDGDVFDREWNTALACGSPTPVGRTGRPGGASDVWGNVWQWLRDDFRPLPGFMPHRYYDDFSAPYFGAAHAALIGGSWASTGSTASRWYRVWFRRHFYQHAGFRLSRPVAP